MKMSKANKDLTLELRKVKEAIEVLSTHGRNDLAMVLDESYQFHKKSSLNQV